MLVETNVTKLVDPDNLPFTNENLEQSKPSFNVRRVDLSQAKFLVTKAKPCAGDLVLAKIVKIGQHRRIHLTTGRRARLYQGDEVILTYANRYALDQFEAEMPDDLSKCHMAAAGGVASKILSSNVAMKNPTVIKPVGLLADANGRVMNTEHWALPKKKIPANRQATIIVVVGTEMNSGKTATASSIIRGAVKAGLRVGAAKVTGTGAAGDYSEMTDAGAHYVYDLIDAGHPSSYKLSNDKVLAMFETLTANLLDTDAEFLVLEIADGILQQETVALLNDSFFQNNIDSIILAASDALAAKAGASIIKKMNLPLLAISGKVTGSRIGRKAVKKATRCKVISPNKLSSSATIPGLLPRLDTKEAL